VNSLKCAKQCKIQLNNLFEIIKYSSIFDGQSFNEPKELFYFNSYAIYGLYN